MKTSLSIKLKAAFLLFVFLINAVIGFACSVGLNMGFSGNHYHKEETTHVKHHSHQHQKGTEHHSPKDKNNCCNDEVIKFSSIDKCYPPSFDFNVTPVFFTAFFCAYIPPEILSLYKGLRPVKYFVRGHHPPIADIRIAIQSFQI